MFVRTTMLRALACAVLLPALLSGLCHRPQ